MNDTRQSAPASAPETKVKLRAKLEALRQTDPKFVQWKILENPRGDRQWQNGDVESARVVGYISGVRLEQILDDAIGPENWEASYSHVGDTTICKLAIRGDDDRWIYKEDGAGDDSDHDHERSKGQLGKVLKANLTDAFKRACRRWGIGRDLAFLPKPFVDVIRRGRSWVIDPRSLARLEQVAATGRDDAQGQSRARPAEPPPASEERRQSPPPARGAAPPRAAAQNQQGPAKPAGAAAAGQGARRSGMLIPMGRTKGTPIEDAEAEDLGNVIRMLEAKLANNESRYPRQDTEWVAAARAELTRRKSDGRAAAGA